MVWDLDPTLIELGPVTLSWYGVMFALAAIQGVLIFRHQLARGEGSPPPASPMLWMGLLGIIVGGRLVHICFYQFGELSHSPLHVLTSWRSGFASHGSTAGMLVALWFYGRRFGMPFLDACDRLAIAVPLGTSLVRVGNFLNSEIVGRPTDVPWAVVFSRYDAAVGLPATARHPSQLYEAALGVLVFVLLWFVDRRTTQRVPGVMLGIIFIGYFSTRILVELVKEHQALPGSWPVTMGQLLSVPFVIAGAILIARARRA
jgi:phosphatidylglycerol:prolipoprotein diacylglycerol transferase